MHIKTPHLLIVIGLISELMGAFLLATRDLDVEALSAACRKFGWRVSSILGIIGIALFTTAVIFKGDMPILVWLGAVIFAASLTPMVLNIGLRFHDEAGERVPARKVHAFNVIGLSLISIGFVIQSLAAVLE